MYIVHVENDDDPNDLIERVKQDGGSIAVFRHVYSLGPITWLEDVFEYVPPGGSTLLSGLKHALISLLVGPWGVAGPLFVLPALIVNLKGGYRTTQYSAAEVELEPRLQFEMMVLDDAVKRFNMMFVIFSLPVIAVVALWWSISTYL